MVHGLRYVRSEWSGEIGRRPPGGRPKGIALLFCLFFFALAGGFCRFNDFLRDLLWNDIVV